MANNIGNRFFFDSDNIADFVPPAQSTPSVRRRPNSDHINQQNQATGM